MKIIPLLLFSALTVFAQEKNSPDSRIAAPPQLTPQQIAAQQMREKAAALGGHVLRKVDGKTYNLWQTGQFIGGVVQAVEGDVVILRGYDTKFFALRNFKGEALTDHDLSAFALANGTYTWNKLPVDLDLYDCGTLLDPAEERREEQALREKTAETEKAKAAVVAAKLKEKQAKEFLFQSNIVAHLQTPATNGEAWAQCSLGLHYLRGQGCDTNRELAMKWLNLAAAQGDYEAVTTVERLVIRATPPAATRVNVNTNIH